MKLFLALLCFAAAIFCGLFFNIYLLVTGILDIFTGGSIFWGVVKIAFRELVGFILFVGLWALGLVYLKEGVRG